MKKIVLLNQKIEDGFRDYHRGDRKMNRKFRNLALYLTLFVFVSLVHGQKPEGTMAFTVSMEQPHTHYYHVVFRCKRFEDHTLDFKMPAWTPGYYRIMDYAKNVLNFHAQDGEGNVLAWKKTAKNTWQIACGKSVAITVSYDVYAFRRSVAESFLDDRRAFIAPASVFMHIGDRIDHPVTVTVEPNMTGDRISTGLDPVEGRPNTFYAPDFDVLYDCPILIGNQEILTFEVQGIPHVIAVENLGSYDRDKFVTDIKKIVESAVKFIGEIPYKHYTFIMMDQGGGGLEHLNSMAVFSNSSGWSSPQSYQGWLSFIAHEFYHLYNVKRIRPIALGPFDYDRENYTTMLWVSEGFTVYYEYLILRRAGLLSRKNFFEQVRRYIANYENRPGHLFQSAAESSFDTWMKFFERNENSANTTISYYDKGAALGLLLDLKIRHESKNTKSLDDVMRTLYEKFYKERKRGFTDLEFREVCEDAAGCTLSEIFDDYVATAKEIDYPKYFAYAGLEIDVTPKEQPGVFFGAATRVQDGSLIISSVEWESPAQNGGLSAQDEILALDGVRASARTLSRFFSDKRPGDKIQVLVQRRGMIQEKEIVLASKMERSFRIRPMSGPDPLQASILTDWLRKE
jgi:predicted metalloprotease with PDZ domain